MTVLGTALRPAATKVMLLGSGELGKEVAIECQRLGIETIAVDRYPDAPAMQVAHRAHVINMLHGESLRALIEQEKPDYIVPEIRSYRYRHPRSNWNRPGRKWSPRRGRQSSP